MGRKLNHMSLVSSCSSLTKPGYSCEAKLNITDWQWGTKRDQNFAVCTQFWYLAHNVYIQTLNGDL